MTTDTLQFRLAQLVKKWQSEQVINSIILMIQCSVFSVLVDVCCISKHKCINVDQLVQCDVLVLCMFIF